MSKLKFTISDEFFSGYEVPLDLNYFESIEDICFQVKQTLMTFLEVNKLRELKRKAEKLNFHIHDLEFGNLLLMPENTVVWVCSHCNALKRDSSSDNLKPSGKR
tara:strand:- start:100 stop:411 length:312 start_codon:yes stop_codon:yes gene_type:complete